MLLIIFLLLVFSRPSHKYVFDVKLDVVVLVTSVILIFLLSSPGDSLRDSIDLTHIIFSILLFE